jgi:hypothetical protein
MTLTQVYDPRRGPKPQTVYDPRVLLTGAVDAIGKWRGGLFDEGSFCETLAGVFPFSRSKKGTSRLFLGASRQHALLALCRSDGVSPLKTKCLVPGMFQHRLCS